MTDAERRIVEAAVTFGAIATDRDWENTVWVAHMDFWEPAERDALEALGHAVAAYEQAQVVQPSPANATRGTNGGEGSASPAAGDQQYNKARYDALYEAMREERESLIFEIADRNAAQLAALRALVARKNAALHAAADALDAIADFYPGDPTTEAARDAARAAATEGGNAAD